VRRAFGQPRTDARGANAGERRRAVPRRIRPRPTLTTSRPGSSHEDPRYPNALPEAELPPGDYCFVIQQTSPIVQSYSLEFVVEAPVPARGSTWSAIKTLYR
jgi:hypothetical protein